MSNLAISYRSCSTRFSFLTVFLVASVAMFMLTPTAFAATEVTGSISTDTVWTEAGSPYVIPDGFRIRVNAGVILTIGAGAVVKAGSNSGINVNGTLNVLGTAEKPAYLTSLRNDANSGDTNGDADLTEPSESDRWNINFNFGSGPHKIEHTDFSYSYDTLFFYGTSADFNDVRFENITDAIGAGGNSDIGLENVSIQNVAGDGIWGDGGVFVIANSEIRDVTAGRDAASFYRGAKIFLDNFLVDGVGFGAALGLYGAHATATASRFASGMDSGVELYRDFSFGGSSIYLADSTIEDFGRFGLAVFGSSALVERTTLRGNGYGARVGSTFEFQPNVSVDNSSIFGNLFYGFFNSTTTVVDARANFWGDATGPFHPALNPAGFGDEVSDNVDFSDWLSSDPLAEVLCCSSVAFIPGLEASRLYKEGILFEDKLWEPNNNHDVAELALSTTTGESVNAGIYTRDVLDEPLGFPIAGNIYKEFIARMESLVADGVINAFEPLPYDWRFDVRDVAVGDIALQDGASYAMVSRIEALATSSETGKVTLITHSNGGLVAKELLSELARLGKAGLIDRVIMVAAPELGTPDAVLQLLHGSEFFLGLPSREATRELGENMKSAYALLPSREYFTRQGAPLMRPMVEFSTTTDVTEEFRTLYGDSISDYDSLRRFLRGEDGSRAEPATSEVDVPNVLKENFLSNAEEYHGAADTWTPPSGIPVIEVVGWGLATPYGIKYASARKRVCNENNSACLMTDVLDPEPLDTFEGDATVVVPSAEALQGERYYVDVYRYNKVPGNLNREHKNILEINSLQDLITALIKNESTSTLPAFISSTRPEITDADKRVRLSAHSPVLLHLSDSLGRHTGPVPNTNPDSDFKLVEEQIPNSYYWRIGEGQYAGAGGDATTTVTLYGSGLGTFTIDIEELLGGEVATTTIFEDIPTATTTVATLEAGGSVSPVLSLDIDGDGNTDAEVTPGGLTAEELVGIVKGLIKTLELPPKKEKELLKRMDKLEKELMKERKKERLEKLKTKQAFAKVFRLISLYEKKKLLTAGEATELITMLENIMNMVVE
ncbi:MAG TPA: hypothetical protein DEF00_03535 [Candidatus Taylorbacteria bacterium]|nr:MAG: Parallel beta-helix repeat protein [Parcubacteria group bacterium GW2011_GWA2_47_64]KKU96899.1 MAG: Parallel beta-helix repeat protein [Parcubacteria group bacterium GW2011_GWC2_48_17]HBV01436.1 hypothetical protein [Candidatus Taylorbacteria bacterium]